MNARGWPDALFAAEPEHWGLRGDPHLWEELRDALRAHEPPSSPEALQALILNTLNSLLGCPIDRDLRLYVERLAHGGMSSGYVSGHWWIEKAIPELLRRFVAMSPADEGRFET